MLILSRKVNETIMIGDDIEIRVTKINGDKVRLSIEAPDDVQVHRREVYDAIQVKLGRGEEPFTPGGRSPVRCPVSV